MSEGLTAKVVRIHRALLAADLPHAFGGAFALAFCIEEPRGTKDIDLNVFVGVERMLDVVAALPDAITADDDQLRQLERDGQVRLRWDDTPIDVFLSNVPFHDHAGANLRRVPFAGVDEVPVLSCADLAVFKAFFARPKDAIDVANMIDAGTVDRHELEATVVAMLGDDERRHFFERVDDALEG